MKNKKFNWILAGTLSLLIFACDDIFEINISSEQIKLLAPSDLLLTENTVHTFWWEEVEGATEYTLQIVEGTFAAASAMMLDTTLTLDKYQHTLSSGDYQWRVRAQNSVYKTDYSVHTLFVDSSIVISTAEIVLISPAEGYASSDLNIDFNWEEMQNADFYLWQLRDTSGNLLSQQNDLINTTTNFTFSEDDLYTWQVQGFNNTSNTFTSFSSRTMYVDRQAPQLASLTSPENGDTLSVANQIVFKWESQQSTANESKVLDYLYVAADSSFSESPVIVEDGAQTHSQSLSEGTYYWKVERIDAAENTTATTEINQFVVESE